MALNGERSSCETSARNSSFERLAASAAARGLLLRQLFALRFSLFALSDLAVDDGVRLPAADFDG
jgi:hypothetical protein